MNKKIQLILLFQVLFIGIFAKSMSLISKIIMTRELGVEAMSLFSLVNPLILLLLTLSSLSLQNAIGSLISKNPEKRKSILLSALLITICASSILMFLLFICSKFIANNLLNNPLTYSCIIASIFVIPLTSISSIIKGYFLGIGELKLTSGSQIFEECGRLLFIIIILFFLPNLSAELKASIAIFSLCVGEIFQVVYMLVFYKNTKFSKFNKLFSSLQKQKLHYKEILNISIPMTLSRLVGSLTYFLEPIIFTLILSKNNYTTETITLSYGILNSYALPLLLMPGFISVTLSNLIIPTLGNLIRNKDMNKVKRYIINISLICFGIGLLINIVFFLFPNIITTLIYGNNYGADLIRKYSLFFVIYYVETPIITCMSLLNLSKNAFTSTVVSSILRIILMLLLVGQFAIDGLCIAIIASTYIDVLMNIYYLFSFFIRNNKRPLLLQD